MGTTDRAGARNVLSSSVPWGSFQSVKCRDAFRTREATHHEGRDPLCLPFPSLPFASFLRLSVSCSLSSPLPAAPPLVPARRIRILSSRFALFRHKACVTSTAHNVLAAGHPCGVMDVCGMPATALLLTVLHACLHYEVDASTQPCIHTGCLQTRVSADCSLPWRWPSTCQPRGSY